MEDFFGFSTSPFSREMAIAKRFRLEGHEEQAARLKEAVENRMSGLVIAPAGTGKTVMLRSLSDQLPDARYRTHYIKVTKLSKRDLCRELAFAIGAESAGTFPMLVRKVQEQFIILSETDGLRPVIILDEAHDLKPEGAAMIRLLTNFEMDSKLVVSIVLVGQPPLKRLLYRQELEDIRQRLAHCGELRLLTKEEATGYIKHRLSIAGAKTNLFDKSAIEGVYETSRGNMRAIDRICLKSLQIAYQAKAKVVDFNHVTEARSELWV